MEIKCKLIIISLIIQFRKQTIQYLTIHPSWRNSSIKIPTLYVSALQTRSSILRKSFNCETRASNFFPSLWKWPSFESPRSRSRDSFVKGRNEGGEIAVSTRGTVLENVGRVASQLVEIISSLIASRAAGRVFSPVAPFLTCLEPFHNPLSCFPTACLARSYLSRQWTRRGDAKIKRFRSLSRRSSRRIVLREIFHPVGGTIGGERLLLGCARTIPFLLTKFRRIMSENFSPLYLRKVSRG